MQRPYVFAEILSRRHRNLLAPRTEDSAADVLGLGYVSSGIPGVSGYNRGMPADSGYTRGPWVCLGSPGYTWGLQVYPSVCMHVHACRVATILSFSFPATPGGLQPPEETKMYM